MKAERNKMSSAKRKQDATTGMVADPLGNLSAASGSISPRLRKNLSSLKEEESNVVQNSPREYVHELLDICRREQDGYHPVLDCVNRYDRYSVVLCNPELVDLLLEDASEWKRSKAKTLYLLSESDEVLQKAIGTVVKKCNGKLFLRLFSRQVPLQEYEHLPLGGWIQVLTPDDHSPPARRVLVLAFRLGDMPTKDRDEFLDGAKHHFADLVLFERVPDADGQGGPGTEHRLSLKEWATLMRAHGGLPNEKAAIYSRDQKCFVLVVRFFHQGEQELRQFVRKSDASPLTDLS